METLCTQGGKLYIIHLQFVGHAYSEHPMDALIVHIYRGITANSVFPLTLCKFKVLCVHDVCVQV